MMVSTHDAFQPMKSMLVCLAKNNAKITLKLLQSKSHSIAWELNPFIPIALKTALAILVIRFRPEYFSRKYLKEIC